MPTKAELRAAASLIISDFGMGQIGFKKRKRDAAKRRRLGAVNPVLTAETASALPHYVYVFGADGGAVKIGIAADPHKRLSQVQTGHPQRLRIEAAIEVADRTEAARIERAVHARLSDKRETGEWFLCRPDEAAAAIRSLL